MFLGGIATAVGVVAGAFAIYAGVQNITAKTYAAPSNLIVKVASTEAQLDAAEFVVPAGAPLPAPGDGDGLCNPTQLRLLRKTGVLVDPQYEVTLTNSFAGGTSGTLYLRDLQAEVVSSSPAAKMSAEEVCPSAGVNAESQLVAKLDQSPTIWFLGQYGTTVDEKLGRPTFSLDPGETVSFLVTLDATKRNYKVDLVGTLTNGDGTSWPVDITRSTGALPAPSDGAALQIGPGTEPGTFECTFPDIPSPGVLGGTTISCDPTTAPTPAQVSQLEQEARASG